MRIDPRSAILAAALSLASCTTPVAPGNPVPGTDLLHITAVAPRYPGRVPTDDRWFIYLEGYIDTGATARLQRLLDGQRIRSAVVYFDSPGGHVVEAMALGRLLRARRLATSVGASTASIVVSRAGHCYSACPIAYAGGVRRSLEPGSVLGVHRAENSVPVPDEAAFQGTVTGQVRNYLAEMGVSPELAAIMSAVPNDTIHDLSTAEAARLRLVNVSAR